MISARTINRLSDLKGDVNIASLSDTQILRYDNASGKWINVNLTTTLAGLTDVTLTSVANNNLLRYNSVTSKWVNIDSASDFLNQYFLLAGRSGGQIAYGDTAASGTLSLRSTAHPTKGKTDIGQILYVDEANSRVGIGNSSPANKVSIGTLTTADSLPQLTISTGATTNKGLLIQAVASQSGNLIELQTSAGAAVTSFDSGGILQFATPSSAGYMIKFDGTNNFIYRNFNTIVWSSIGVLGFTYNTSEPSSAFVSIQHPFGAAGVGALTVKSPTTASNAIVTQSYSGFTAYDILGTYNTTGSTYRNAYGFLTYVNSGTDASRKLGFIQYVSDSGGDRELFRAYADGAVVRMGWMGATPIARPSANTLTGVATRTMPTDVSSAYTGQDNLQMGSVYAKSADLETLRQTVSSLIGYIKQLSLDLGNSAGFGLLNC